jgi:predicted GNAT family acetyltransferase
VSKSGPAPDRVVRVVNDPINRFYELSVDGVYAGILIYELAGDRRVLTHTYIEEAFRGEGLVTTLIHEAMDDLLAKAATVTNYCPIVDSFIQKHPEYEALIDPIQPGNRRGTSSVSNTGTMSPDLDTKGQRRLRAHSLTRAAQ